MTARRAFLGAGLAIAVASAAFGGPSPLSARAQQGENGFGGLAAGDGREVVHAVCTGCHSARLVTQQNMSRKRWDKTLDWMVEKQNMPELDPESRKTVLDYLARHYGPRQGRPPGTPSPFGSLPPLRYGQ